MDVPRPPVAADALQLADHLHIRAVIDNWAIWRDSAQWDRLLGTWHEGGRIVTTWFQGSAEQFVALCRASWEAGVVGHHVQGSASVDVSCDRAVAQTRLLLCVRGVVHGIECDSTCTARFYDFFENRAGRWGLVMRQPIYEKDRMDPVSPSDRLVLDAALLARYPVGYRHLAYMQATSGLTVMEGLPGLRGPATDSVYAAGATWLGGGALTIGQ
ncbi:nuclear transport factor 2 family protein [Mesorhizobium sp. M7A.F.Ca.US.006.01.1.1]|uniref:nuclear transport factor 2 family protein n=1 Tax=Mesorhizobium sp. M7A.F.Ca.US.006.01.1.1 TaxID=2496707 RepID=UPI000FCA824C|nr:nuclear transport factor 2 family protein [Mesorhizobium sp. M7A.F.Ca.US.006.01.1.1]RUZ71000.1 nuclear transport factor 2 family protein [Mesorhizobium sp. M7A.F.Ca.US.006.01.1.1]